MDPTKGEIGIVPDGSSVVFKLNNGTSLELVHLGYGIEVRTKGLVTPTVEPSSMNAVIVRTKEMSTSRR